MFGRQATITAQEHAPEDPMAARSAAFERLADRQLVTSYRLAAVLLGSETEAQDAVQDAAVTAWDRFGSLRDPERFDAWFQRILVNGCRERLRRRRRVRTIPLDVALEPPALFPAARLADRDALRQALDELEPDQRTVVVLHYFADLTLDEVAARTGERPGTVRSRLHAAFDAAERQDGESVR